MENDYPCPACGAPADLTGGCAGCRRPPDPEAAEVIRLDRDLVALGVEVERARLAYAELAERFQRGRQRRAELAARVRARVAAPVVALPPVRPMPSPSPAVARPGRPETSARTVQGLLFVLGGLLLGTAAVVFTAVAWASVGIVGRALILAAVTALALAVPLVAVRRGLRGTAETVAAVGLLLVVLDGYAAWSVDLFGVTGWPGTRYAALVGGAGTAVAAGYARLSRLTGPWFAALVAVQPVLPLVVAETRPGTDGWALTLVGVAVLDLALLFVLRRASARPAVVAGRVVTWTAFGAAVVAAAGPALVSLAVGEAAGTPLLAGLPLLVVAATLAGAALLTGDRTARWVGAGLLVPVLAAALLRPVAELRPSLLLLAGALIAAALAGAIVLLPAGWRTGPRVAGLVVASGATAPAALLTVGFALTAVGRSLPPWRGAALGPDVDWGWQLPVAVVLGVAAATLLAPRAVRPVAGPVTLALAVLAVPAGWPSAWSVAVALDLAGAAALLLVAVARPTRGTTRATVAGVAAAVLAGHGTLVALAAPVGALAALGSVALLGVAGAALGRRGEPVASRTVTGPALAAALLAVPAAVPVALLAAGAPAWWQSRAALAAAGLLVAALFSVRRHWPDLSGYASTAVAVALMLTGVAPVLVPADESLALYAALAALPLAVGLLPGAGSPIGRPAASPGAETTPSGAEAAPPRPGRDALPADVVLRVAGSLLLLVSGLAALPALLAALVTPYGRALPVWSGVPAADPVPAALPAGLALVVSAVAVAVAVRSTRAATLLAALPFAAAAPPVLLVAGGAPWPVTPAATLLTGVAALLAAALLAPRPLLVPVSVPVGLPLVAAGLAGLVATRAGTLAGLGLLLVAATVAGTVGRHSAARIAGCLTAVAAGVALAITAPLAGGLPLRDAAFAVLAVAALTLAAASSPLAGERAVVRPVLDAAAQAVALVALLLTLGAPRHAAVVSALWGAAVGLRILRRGEPVRRRWVLAGIAGAGELLGVWLLLVDRGVVLLEAYTLPAAALALAAGLVALRTRPGLTSWLALAPGLGAALLPSLASVLAAPEPQPWRRLLVGVAALAAVWGGAARRWQAPVLLGGVTLTLLAVHELARGWDLLPRWIFLAAGGLALIGLAATYERRRRDLHRLRAAVGRMG
ncbi:SCO7613 C-terminal domain-containing membrane protein [Micromonospora sp. NPDC049366]|uniref:SCO7613 C-terminal domain-containing membrane protein n=1 Tax=Micromonospora sp. NPDC049366 TaxID=3364271 RepID=UPI0037890656